jgi:hypothetical protein
MNIHRVSLIKLLMLRIVNSHSHGHNSATILPRLIRTLQQQIASTTSTLDQKNTERFNPFIFWGINACWVALLFGFIFWLWKCNGARVLIGWTNYNSSNTMSPQRSQESQDDNTPEGKRETLMEYFRQRKVHMVSHIN